MLTGYRELVFCTFYFIGWDRIVGDVNAQTSLRTFIKPTKLVTVIYLEWS
jgi:hypothetical protein